MNRKPTTCFVCGKKLDGICRPLHTPVYGDIEIVGWIYVCMDCWNARTDRVERHTRQNFDAELCQANDGLRVFKKMAEGEEWKFCG